MPLVAFYVLSMVFLCMHLYHGTWSVFQTLGVDSPLWNRGLRVVAKTVAVILFIGFSAVPVSVALDIVPAPAQTAVAAH
jgi:succinate dehydrogenase / fumarate reductase cytochrome b subunit